MKKFLVGALIVASSLGVAACSSNKTDSSNASSDTQSAAPSPVEQWRQTNGQDVQNLIDDFQVLQDDVNNGAPDAAIGYDCAAIGGDAQTILNDGAFPDPVKGPALNSSMNQIVSAATACVVAVETGDYLLMQQAGQGFVDAFKTLNNVSTGATA